MRHKFKAEIIDWLNGGKYEGRWGNSWGKIERLSGFETSDEIRKVDEYKHLREAEAQGKDIQFMGPNDTLWITIKSPINFNSPVSCYRIKPKTKKMVQWLLKTNGSTFCLSSAFYESGVTPELIYEKPIKPLPHTEIEVEA